MSEFESVKKGGPVWNPTSKGSARNSNLVKLEATDKSFIIGYFIGTETGQGPEGNSTIHKLKFDSVGDESHLSEPVSKGDEVSIWGSTVLDDRMSSVTPGQLMRAMWEGKKSGQSGRSYNVWDVGINRSVEPITLDSANSSIGNVSDESEPVATSPSIDKVSETKEPSPVVDVSEDDDPFA